MLPSKNDLDILKSVRGSTPKQAILMLTAKSFDVDQIIGLDLGEYTLLA